MYMEEEEFLDEYERGDGYAPQTIHKEKVKELFEVRFLNRFDQWTSLTVWAFSKAQAVLIVSKKLHVNCLNGLYKKGSEQIQVRVIG